MKIQYASDLHLEFILNKKFLKANPLPPKGDVLVLAGDIVPFKLINEHNDFFNYLSDNFEMTFWVPGNHEYYNYDIEHRSGSFHEKVRKNVILVDNQTIVHDNVSFIFSTLWSFIKTVNQFQIELGVSDFSLIKKKGNRFTSEDFNQLHKDCLAFIKRELAVKTTNKKIVVSHHVPTQLNYPPEFKNDLLNDAFVVELYDLIEENGPDYWIYGHTHRNTPDFNIGKTKLVTNQLGYVKYGEHGSYIDGKVLIT